MGGPADVRMRSDASARLFLVTEADALVPRLEQIFRHLDPMLGRLREQRELIEDTEAYYGEDLATASPEDRSAHAKLLQERADLEQSVQTNIEEVQSFGCEVKDLHRGLVDFPSIIGDELAYLCWQRGEDRIGWWHTLEGGFTGRKALVAESER